MDKPHARSCTLYKRKSTLFSKGLKLHTMTKAEVLIIIDQQNGQRFVCGSDKILDTYNKGQLRPTQTDQKYEGATMTEPSGNTDIPGVEPLHDTPENVSLDPRLASVLGHEAGDVANNTQSRRRLSYRPSKAVGSTERDPGNEVAVVPAPVQELLQNKPKPRLNDEERSNVPLIQRQSRITFVSHENITSNC